MGLAYHNTINHNRETSKVYPKLRYDNKYIYVYIFFTKLLNGKQKRLFVKDMAKKKNNRLIEIVKRKTKKKGNMKKEN